MHEHVHYSGTITEAEVDCIVLGVYEKGQLPDITKEADKAMKGLIRRLCRSGDFSGKSGITHLLHEVPGFYAPRIMLVGLGEKDPKKNNDHRKHYQKTVMAAAKALKQAKYHNIINTLPHSFSKKDMAWALLQSVVSSERALNTYPAIRKEQAPPVQVKHFHWVSALSQKNAYTAIVQGQAIAKGMEKMLLVADHPANLCTPTSFATLTKKWVADIHREDANIPITAIIHKPEDLKKLGMRSFLSVAQGSDQPPCLLEIVYCGSQYTSRKKKVPSKILKNPIVLVGKGVTFDSGGISLKPGAEMDHMKWDMCGAASVLGALLACAHMRLPMDVVGIMPLTENLPSGKAVKPSDVITTMSGLTVENLNTDAEGRLILCDALTYAQKKYKPKALIDIATLTGACVVALGSIRMALYANDNRLAKTLLEAGEQIVDLAWRMPMDTEYLEGMKSNFADIANIGGRGGGSITAAMFLSKFIEPNVSWAHLDIAGVAYQGSGSHKGATGRPLPLLMSYLMDMAEVE